MKYRSQYLCSLSRSWSLMLLTSQHSLIGALQQPANCILGLILFCAFRIAVFSIKHMGEAISTASTAPLKPRLRHKHHGGCNNRGNTSTNKEESDCSNHETIDSSRTGCTSR
ncbi:hypothetical protein BC830DRAFT_1133874 [Chytriomyces sp. MP71]|nr:hypothetical protein BC830DRAFT_1133874 [Chytriomyces sp. MP71]